MKFLISAAASFVALTGAAAAGDLADQCRATLEAEGRDTSGCECLEGKVLENPDLQSEFQSLGDIDGAQERYAAASDEAKAAMDACTR